MTTDNHNDTEIALENREEIAEALEMDGMAQAGTDAADGGTDTDAPEETSNDERMRFDELGLPPELLAAVHDLGFTHPPHPRARHSRTARRAKRPRRRPDRYG